MALVSLESRLSQIKDPEPIESKESNVPKKMSSATPYVRTIVNSEKTPSPIEILHSKETSRTGRFPLAEYYAQATTKGRLAYRNNDVTGFDQPFVIRAIGQRWGVDRIELGDSTFANAAEKVINPAFNLLNEAGEAIIGRNPSEYVGYGLGSIQRIGKFLGTPQGIAFLTKQQVLMRRNKFSSRTDAKYGVFDDPGSIANASPVAVGNLLNMIENPKLYNPLSLGSLPGVTKIDILAPDPGMIIDPYLDTLASLVSEKALELASDVGEEIIDLSIGALGLIAGTLGKINIPSINLPKVKLPSINWPTVSTDKLKAGAEKIGKTLKKGYEVFKDVNSALSKGSLTPFNAQAFSEVGVDKVNLIPYGKRNVATYAGKTEEELDFIPFRFEDMKGNIIVFRALLSGITDTFTPEYSSERYVGRPDQVHVYQGTNREVSFTFDIYPKSDQELPVLWEKMNRLAGLTYPSWEKAGGGGMGMVAPFCKLTIGDMFKNTSGYISSLTYTVQDNGTWETTFAKLPKYIQASCTFVYIGDRLPASDQKFYEVNWVGGKKYKTDNPLLNFISSLGVPIDSSGVTDLVKKNLPF